MIRINQISTQLITPRFYFLPPGIELELSSQQAANLRLVNSSAVPASPVVPSPVVQSMRRDRPAIKASPFQR